MGDWPAEQPAFVVAGTDGSHASSCNVEKASDDASVERTEHSGRDGYRCCGLATFFEQV
jgi:hypothetical protein